MSTNEQMREALKRARKLLCVDRQALHDSHVQPSTGRVEGEAAEALAEYDDALSRIDAALATPAEQTAPSGMHLEMVDRPGVLSTERMRQLFEASVLQTEKLKASLPLDRVAVGGEFREYMRPEVQSAWVGFAIGMRCAERVRQAEQTAQPVELEAAWQQRRLETWAAARLVDDPLEPSRHWGEGFRKHFADGWHAALQSQAAEVEALRKDAERYRWLRSSPFRSDWAYDEDGSLLGEAELDAAIDAALAASRTDGSKQA